ncbi:MAG: SdrD B-like domain-containing protein [Beutenbergiaceae bacterium]
MIGSRRKLLRAAVASGVALCLLAVGFPTGAQAAPVVQTTVSVVSDGTQVWDDDDLPGNDSGPNNGIVRVNDTVSYRVDYNVNGESADGVIITMAFPPGMMIDRAPSFCTGPQTGVVPASAGVENVALPLSDRSVEDLQPQTLTCDIPGPFANVSRHANFQARVSNLVHHGTALTPSAVTVSGYSADNGDSQAVAAPQLPTVLASSALKWDISKNGIGLEEDKGYLYGPEDRACTWDSARACQSFGYTVLISAPTDGKGAMPAVGNISFTDDLSAQALFTTLDANAIAAINAEPERYGARIVGTNVHPGYRPGERVGSTTGGTGHTPTNSVRDSGSLSYAPATGQISAPNTAITVTIEGADMTLLSVPSQALEPAGTALPAGRAYAVSLGLRVEIPVETVQRFGASVDGGSTWTLPMRNSYTNLRITGFQGSSQTSLAGQEWNDYRTGTGRVKLPGAFDKWFTGLPGAAGNMAPAQFNPIWKVIAEGPPGGATLWSGGITVAPSQTVLSTLNFVGSKLSNAEVISAVGCDAWDNSLMHLRTGDYGPASGPDGQMQQVPSGGQGVWVTGYNNIPGGPYATRADQTPELTVQYSAQPGLVAASTACDDGAGPWYDSPELVPGNDPALAAQGIYSAVGRVRVHLVLPEPASFEAQSSSTRVQVGLALRVADGLATGTEIPNFGSITRVRGAAVDLVNVLENGHAWEISQYDPSEHAGRFGDRVTVVQAQVRVDKQVRQAGVGEYSDTPPQMTGGQLAEYRIQPSLTSGAATPGIFQDVWVEDCLPGSQLYLSATIAPAVISHGTTPADAQRSPCSADETYIRWVLPDREVNQPIDPIVLTAEVAASATSGSYSNDVVVWAADDVAAEQVRTDDASVSIENSAGVQLEKRALTPLLQVNRSDAEVTELNRWDVRFTNALPASDGTQISEVDIIDTLPAQGLHGTDFNGSMEFVDATVALGDQVTILYSGIDTSSAAYSIDPEDPSNSTAGSTTWCDAPGGAVVLGTGTCPATAAEVTALRIQRHPVLEAGQAIRVIVQMLATGNAADDIYVNQTFGRAQGLALPVGPISRPEGVVSSSLGDRVWWDLDRDGVQGADEPDATGVPVTLTGTDDLGNTISLSTRTGDDGRYSFAGLRGAGSAGYTVTFGLPAGASGFTTANVAEGGDAADSDADTDGVVSGIALGQAVIDDTIDAGLLAEGSLTIRKAMTGPVAADYAADDFFTLTVTCTLGAEEVYNDTVTLEADGVVDILSQPLGPIPASASCRVAEIDGGDASLWAEPVTVEIAFDAQSQTVPTVEVEQTNTYEECPEAQCPVPPPPPMPLNDPPAEGMPDTGLAGIGLTVLLALVLLLAGGVALRRSTRARS